MDHHCPAIGKQLIFGLISQSLGRCVHLGNQKYFLIYLAHSALFGLYTFVTMLPLLVIESARFYTFRLPKGYSHKIFTIPFAFAAFGCVLSLVSCYFV